MQIVHSVLGWCCINVYLCGASDLAYRALSSEVSVLESEPKLTDVASSNAESVNVLLTHWGEQIFHRGFGTIFGLWLGRNGCPFV